MNWLSLVSIFAKPVGAIINKALAAGAAAVVGYGVSKGWDATSLTMITSEVVVAISTIISGVAATQGVQIPIINADPNNGVKVVSASSPSPPVTSGK